MQKSRSFILPMINLKVPNSTIINTYLGNTEYQGDNNWGKYLYVEIEDQHIKSVWEEIKTHPQYVTYFHCSENSNAFIVFEITNNQRKIVDPFLQGKYSEIDRDYVNKYFTKYINENISLNWRILHKDENWDRPANLMSLRDYWYSRIGIEIPKDAEVWSRPKQEDEIYRYLE